MTRLRAAALFLFVAALSVAGCDPATPGGPERTELLWDEWGVPHIYAPSPDSAFFAFGWAQMRAHGDRILRLYGQTRGRAAEYFGPDYLDSDRRIRTLGLPRRARSWDAAQSAPYAGYVDAFVAGMNAYADAHPDRLGTAVKRVLPVRATDVYGQMLRSIHYTFLANEEAGAAREWGARRGSNAWAVGPSRTASDNAMLLSNPHLPWRGLFTWFEGHLVGPEFSVYGAALVGTPIPAIAFNDHLGWTHTVNPLDGADLYRLQLTGDGRYRWDDSTRAFETRTDTLRVRGDDGTVRGEPHTVRRSVHGPVLATADGEALALRVAALDASALVEQYWQMLTASSLSDFESAMQMLQIPMFNTVYADRDGHIFYHFGGRIPKRPRGDWTYWQGIVPGDTSGTLWTDIHPYPDLPRVVDPPSGWIQNANEPPFTATLPRTQGIRPDRFPAYLTPRTFPDVRLHRPQRSMALVSRDSSMTFDEMIDYRGDTRMGAADRLLDDLLGAIPAGAPDRVRRAATVLRRWDRTAEADCRGSVLFLQWHQRLLQTEGSPYATPFDLERPRTTPDGLANPERAVDVLGDAAQAVEQRFDSLDVAWGTVHRLPGRDTTYAASGGPGAHGLFRTLYFGPAEETRRVARGGNSYVAVTEFTPEGPRARVILPYGNASQEGSPHRYDQMALFAEKKMRRAWLDRDSVEAHTDERVRW